jgi:HlyD family secretion protein
VNRMLLSGTNVATLDGRPSHDGPRDRQPIMVGLTVAGIFLGGFGLWAGFAPLSSAAVTLGEVRVESHRKSVQHLEGGIIRKILVREGQEVQAGQLLLLLDDTQSATALAGLRGTYGALRAQEARLVAERDGRAAIAFPGDVQADCRQPNAAEICSSQERIFANRQQILRDQVALLGQRVDQLRSEIEGRRARVAAISRENDSVREQIKGVEPLVKMQLLPRPRLLTLQQEGARLDGDRGEQQASISKAEQEIGEAQMRSTSLINQRQSEVSDELRDIQEKVAAAAEKMRAAADVQQRTEIVAPQAGKIVNLRYFTSGGVVKPGDLILDIVPQHDTLMIETQVRPLDIEAIHSGLRAEIRLIAYTRQRSTPTIHGKVSYVSPDTLTNEHTGQSYYLAHIELDPAELERFGDIKLYPGMPAQVFIVTGERTMLAYLLSPIRDSFARAFREK